MRNRFHAICPYFAMFPEDFAERWISKLTVPGDVVLDPFCGRGTAPFQALLMDRQAVAGDINPVAYCITRAKTNAPSLSAVRARITRLENEFEPEEDQAAIEMLPEFFRHAFSIGTLRQLMYLRRRLRWKESDVDCMIAALTLGGLHGESERSQAYLSNQMPRTISTKPAYSVRYWKKRRLKAPHRDAFALLRDRATYRYVSPRPSGRATVVCTDMRELPRRPEVPPGSVRAVITSPPYLDITNFEEDQWLRLWFLDGPPEPTRFRLSRDDRHYNLDSYWGLIADTWRTLGRLLEPDGEVVFRLGFKNLTPERIVEGVLAASQLSKRPVEVASHEVSDIRRRQTDAFRPGSKGCLREVDVHLRVS
jgi:hypothetical protein